MDLDRSAPDYPPGSACWVDLLVTDVARAQRVYSTLFGWQWRAGDSVSGGYPLALLHGHPVAGLRQRPPDSEMPSQWTTYLKVADGDAALATIAELGGRPLGEPTPWGSLARTMLASDPDDTVFGICESDTLAGSGLIDLPGSPTWHELLTRRYDPVQQFHAGAFGHRFDDHTEEEGPRWSVAYTSDGSPAYGLSEVGADWAVEIRSHWLVSFATDEVVPSIATALSAGGTVLQSPFDGPFGLGAVLAGPEGEVFSVLVPESG